MNFTSQIKNEIIDKKMNRNEIIAFISGMSFANIKSLDDQKIQIKILNNGLLSKLVKKLNAIKYDFETTKNSIVISQDKIKKISPSNANWYFAGIFFSSGSISNLTSSSYHLQLSFKNEMLCEEILNFSTKHLKFSKTKNKNYFILYLKRNEAISDFLYIIGAQNAYFNFIESVIERDFKNQITRIFNLDVHNQNRLVDSNIQFKENYQYIIDNKLTHKFSNIQLEFYEFKKNHEFYSLSQLSEEILKQKKIRKTKSCLNHWLIKLRNIREEHERKK